MFLKKKLFHKQEFLNKIFCNLLFIIFIIASLCHMFSISHFYETRFFKSVQILEKKSFVSKLDHDFKSYNNMLKLKFLFFVL
jgi:hypothetical protein